MAKGTVVWRELMSNDSAKSAAFYSELFGWKAERMDMPGMPYTIFKVGERMVAGMMDIPSGAPIPSHWSSYVEVDDADATAKLITSLGGQVVAGPMDVEGVGRIGSALDPQHAAFAFMKSATPSTPTTPGLGEFCWEQIHPTDVDAAIAFYSKVFGWTSVDFPGAPMKVVKAGDIDVASVMAAPPGVHPHWIHYVVVDDLKSAGDRAARLGGKLMMENVTVPNIGSFTVVQDPVGAFICPFKPAPR